MDRQMRKNIIKRIGDLIEQNCNECTKKVRDKRGNTNEFCSNCKVGAELRSLGELLEGRSEKEEREVPKEDLTVERYNELKNQGLTDRQVAKELKVSLNTLYDFKKENGLMTGRGKHKKIKNDEMSKTVTVKISSFEKAIDETTAKLANILKRKNHDYGDSFSIIYEKYGDISTAIRLFDKLNRFETLINNKQLVSDESKEDTLLDMAGYCILTLVQKKIQGSDSNA